MAKKRMVPEPSRPAVEVPPRLSGLTFVFSGDVRYGNLEDVTRLIQAEGGSVVEEVAKGVDYLVVGWPKRGHPSDVVDKARRLHKSLGKSLQIIEVRHFYKLLAPTREETIALLNGGPTGLERWKNLTEHLSCFLEFADGIDLAGEDFRGADLHGIELECVKFKGNDFSGANLAGARFESAVNCKFDGASMRGASVARSRNCSFREVDLVEGSVYNAGGCTFDGARINGGSFTEQCPSNSVKGVDLSDCRFNPVNISRCDFTASKLCRVFAAYTTAPDAVFRDADLTGAGLEHSHFERADFTGADLSKANLAKSDFTGAILRGAKLAGADLRGAILAGADLVEADFRGAILADADLRGAVIDGADFQDANVFKANLDGLDQEKARNLVRERDQSGKAIGPKVRELAEVARSSTSLETWVKLDLPSGKSAFLMAWSRKDGKGHTASARSADDVQSIPLAAPTFERGLINLAMDRQGGQPKPDGIGVKAVKCRIRKKEALLELVTAAWREALGLPDLSTEEFRRSLQAVESDRSTLRETLIEELRGGREGIQAFNDRPWEQRAQIGPLRQVDLTEADLSEVDLVSLNLDGTSFDGVRLVGANLRACPIKKASFREADLTDSCCWGAKGAEAVFEGATLVKCSFDRAVIRQANFRFADLTEAYLGGADLRAADFTGADLTGANLAAALYDEQTRWPSDFDPPSTMRWKGKGPAPGSSPSKAVKPKVRRRSS